MSRIASILMIILGLLVALVGLGADFVFLNSRPGFNLPQILLIICGFLLSVGALQWRRKGTPSLLKTNVRKHGARVVAVSLVTLAVIEVVLTVSDAPTYFPTDFSNEPLPTIPWWACDEEGCRYVPHAVVSACSKGELQGRFCSVNKQGYADRKDFTIDEPIDATRILFLGDSFTFGLSAELGKSYVETVERNLPEAVVWNAGIVGTGTNQAVASYAVLGPRFRPHLTVLGFYLNDFLDNLFPPYCEQQVVLEDGTILFVRTCKYDEHGNLIHAPWTQATLLFARAGRLPLPNEFERLVGSTRIGSMLLKLKDRFISLMPSREDSPTFPPELERTRTLLNLLQEQVADVDSELLVVLIDEREDYPVLRHEGRFEIALELMHELGLPYVDTRPFIRVPNDFAELPDDHWNSAGHQKIGAILSECIKAYLDKSDLADCQHAVIPAAYQRNQP